MVALYDRTERQCSSASLAEAESEDNSTLQAETLTCSVWICPPLPVDVAGPL